MRAQRPMGWWVLIRGWILIYSLICGLYSFTAAFGTCGTSLELYTRVKSSQNLVHHGLPVPDSKSLEPQKKKGNKLIGKMPAGPRKKSIWLATH